MPNLVSDFRHSVRNWWTYPLLGALFVGVSFFVFSRPVAAYAGLVIYFALTFLISGILRIYFSFTNKESIPAWGWYLAGGFLDLIIGLLLTVRLDLAAVTLPFYVGFFLLFISISEVGSSFDMKSLGLKDWGWLLCVGIAGILFSLMLILNPILGISTIIIWTGLAFLAIGIFYIYLGFRLRRVETSAASRYFSGPRHA